jgi:hypothetical protein
MKNQVLGRPILVFYSSLKIMTQSVTYIDFLKLKMCNFRKEKNFGSLLLPGPATVLMWMATAVPAGNLAANGYTKRHQMIFIKTAAIDRWVSVLHF